MGINLEELSATLGTLSFAFPSAAEGAQGLRSVLSNLIQNGEKFAAIGINVQKVISEEGLTGLFKRLNEATKGNLAAVQELIPDVQGLQAVLATVGPLAEKQAANLEVMANAAGSTGEAFKKTQDTMSASLANSRQSNHHRGEQCRAGTPQYCQDHHQLAGWRLAGWDCGDHRSL